MTEPEAGQPDPDTAPEPAARADAGGSSRRPTESTVRTALLIVLCLLAVLVLRQGRLSATTSGNWDAMSAAILQTVAASEGAVDVSGGYLAGVGMVVHAELSGLSRADVSSWLVRTLSPVSSRIATIPDDEGLVIHIVVTGEGGYQQLVRIRSGDLTDPNRWTQSTDPLPGPPAASAPPAAQPTASASASPSATGTVSASPAVTASASASPSATGTVSASPSVTAS
ncbi:MAG: hypothetical protein QG622_904, partial [Actinomycetota bacterium]|nr:hypothetical protein [Actinomycetota bacterium]